MPELPKTPSGIRGLDELTGGGLPAGRPTLVCGGPGCGKTLLAATFLARGAVDYGFKHMPLVPAGATTVHKVQGQTVVGGIIFDPAEIEAFGKDVARMLGVAFGRVKSLSKLRFRGPIDENLVCNREVQSSLEDMWGLDYMKQYPRVDEAELDKMLDEARPPTVAEAMAAVIR